MNQNVNPSNAANVLRAFGGPGKLDIAAKLRTLNETNRQVRIAAQLLPRTEEQQQVIRERSRILSAIMTAEIQKGRDAFLSNDSGIVQFFQVAPSFGDGTHGRLPSGTEWWRLCDVRMRVAMLNEVKDEKSGKITLVPSEDPEEFVRLGFSINKSTSYTAPAWTTTTRPRSVSPEYAEATKLWLPKDTNKIRELANAETDYVRRREIWASVWYPYTEIVGHVVTACMKMLDQGMHQVFWMRQMARTVQEENELLTPIQGLNGQAIYDDEIVPNIDTMIAESQEKLAEMVTEIERNQAAADMEGAYSEQQSDTD